MIAGLVSVMFAATPEFVLLEPGTTLLPPPGITTDAGTDHPSCCEAGAVTIAARFIADEGELVQIETLGEPADLGGLHCAQTFFDDEWFPHQLSRYRIRVWVRRGSVATVLRRKLESASAKAAAGLPVELRDGGLVQFGLYETTREFSVPVVPGDVGMTYFPSRWTEATSKTAPKSYRLRVGASGSVGDGGSVALLPGEHWPTPAVRRSGADAVIPVTARCAGLSARVPWSALMEVDAGEEGAWGSTHLCGWVSAQWVRQGANVYWPDGTKAGTTSGDGLGGARPNDGGRPCFDITLQGVEGSLPLCFDSRDITDQRPE